MIHVQRPKAIKIAVFDNPTIGWCQCLWEITQISMQTLYC